MSIKNIYTSLFLVACSDYALQESEKYAPGAQPQIEVTPSSLYFSLSTLSTPSIDAFRISNIGNAELLVSDITIVGDTEFSVTNLSGTQNLSPNQSMDVSVTYSPNNAGEEHTGSVLIFSNDPDSSGSEVFLEGIVGQPLLVVEPYILDMGSTPISSTLEGTVTLRSIGDVPVTISEIEIPSTLFSYDPSVSFPIVLAPGEETDFTLSFSSPTGGLFSENITFDTEEPAFDVTTQVKAEAIGGKPIAICEANPQNVQPNGGSATWYGSDSYDEEGFAIMGYEWTLISQPGGSTAFMPAGGANRADFMPDLAGEYIAELVVTNEFGIQSEPCTTSLQAVPGQDLWVQMYWSDSGDDMDLHFLKPGGVLETDGDCYYANCKINGPDWGQLGISGDNPRLDLDDIAGFGPENINLTDPETGTFTVIVHDYPGSTYELGNEVTVVIYIGGSEVWSDTRTITGEDAYTEFAEITWPSGIVNSL